MKKNSKLVLALLLAVMMIVGSFSAVAANHDEGEAPHGALTRDAGTVTINGLMANDIVNLYRIAEWDETNANSVGGWVTTPAYSAILTSEQLAKIIDPGETGYTGITSEVAGDLSRCANKVEVDTQQLSGTTYTKDNLPAGLYMAIITPADVDTVYNPVFVSIDWNAANRTDTWTVTSDSSYMGGASVAHAAKKSTLTLTKTADNANDYNGDNSDTTAVGDVITFTVETTIPGYGKTFDHPQFLLKDVMDKLSLNYSSIKVYNGTKDAKGDEITQYAKSANPTETKGYALDFNEDYLKTLNVPTPIVVTYTATVTEEAKVCNVNQEINTVTLEYSHDPSTESDQVPGGRKKYKKDITNHYTFSIDADNLWKENGKVGESGSELIKIAVDRQGNPIYSTVKTWSNITTTEGETSPLYGAKFTLYKVNKNADDSWNWDSKGAAVYQDVESDKHGRIKFEGLDAGAYILVETSAPAGFVRDMNEHRIVIDATLQPKNFKEYYDQDGNWYAEQGTAADDREPFEYTADELVSYKITFDGEDVATHTFTHVSSSTQIKWSSAGSTELPASIHNTQGVELPSTGGIGTTIFYVGGSLMVLAAAILLITKRRMGVDD